MQMVPLKGVVNYQLSIYGLLVLKQLQKQGRNHGKNLGATSAMVGRICPPGCNRVKVSQNLGATVVASVAPLDTIKFYSFT